jgi:hypothetical protein
MSDTLIGIPERPASPRSSAVLLEFPISFQSLYVALDRGKGSAFLFCGFGKHKIQELHPRFVKSGCGVTDLCQRNSLKVVEIRIRFDDLLDIRDTDVSYCACYNRKGDECRQELRPQ